MPQFVVALQPRSNFFDEHKVNESIIVKKNLFGKQSESEFWNFGVSGFCLGFEKLNKKDREC